MLFSIIVNIPANDKSRFETLFDIEIGHEYPYPSNYDFTDAVDDEKLVVSAHYVITENDNEPINLYHFPCNDKDLVQTLLKLEKNKYLYLVQHDAYNYWETIINEEQWEMTYDEIKLK